MPFEIIGPVRDVQTIAAGASIREVGRLRKAFGRGRWRKRKGIARARLDDGTYAIVELHWHEAHGIGKHDIKIKEIPN